MVQICEVNVLSVDKNEDFWFIDGEIVFESDLNTAFSVRYLPYEDEMECFELDLNPGKYDNMLLKEMILEATAGYDE